MEPRHSDDMTAPELAAKLDEAREIMQELLDAEYSPTYSILADMARRATAYANLRRFLDSFVIRPDSRRIEYSAKEADK